MKIPPGVVIPPIVVDTREQLPYSFSEHPTIISKLHTGDYSIQGLEDAFAVERKELDDFIGCCGKSRERFERELERGKSLRRFWVVIEGTLRQMEKGLYHSKIHPNSVLGTLVAWENRFPVHFWFAGDRELGERITQWILFRTYLDDLEGKI